ncbi:MAG: NAD(P)H-hydrate dehydratase [Lachnospiraceae bacterium]|nr:NAD(P)H-hydrate dehydratase [Lachnospiraceae bacterium]
MKYLLNAKEMQEADKNTIEYFGIPSMVLMERAAISVCTYIIENYGRDKSVLVVCGTGNNGGDGLAIARLLTKEGLDVKVLCIGDRAKASKDNIKQYNICQRYQVEFVEELVTTDVIVDAIFGIGLTREVAGDYGQMIQNINDSSAYVVAVDIPSGLSADNGYPQGLSVMADATVTFGFPKIGHVLFPGRKYCGNVVVADIGIDEQSLLNIRPKYNYLEQRDLFALPKAEVDSHKGSNGKVLCVVGSKEYGGAAYLSSKAAMTIGSGMVYVYTHISNRDFILSKFPEAIVKCYSSIADENEDSFDKDELIELLKQMDAVVIGPGLGTDDRSKNILHTVIENADSPLVIDADAINMIAGDKNILKNIQVDAVMTPHIGEMSRICNNPAGYVELHSLEIANDFAMNNKVNIVLKNAATITATSYGTIYINTSGNEGMAVAGSGDVLSGIIGGLIAQGMNADDAACLGVYIHGLAGDSMIEKCGYHGMVASDLINGLKKVLIEYNL